MKLRIALALSLLSCLVCHADQFFTGAYWTTRAPMPRAQEAGELNVTLHADKSVTLETFHNGLPAIVATGTWEIVKSKMKFTAGWRDCPNGVGPFSTCNTANFSGLTYNGFASGTFSIYYNFETFKGKWQATLP